MYTETPNLILIKMHRKIKWAKSSPQISCQNGKRKLFKESRDAPGLINHNEPTALDLGFHSRNQFGDFRVSQELVSSE